MVLRGAWCVRLPLDAGALDAGEYDRGLPGDTSEAESLRRAEGRGNARGGSSIGAER